MTRTNFASTLAAKRERLVDEKDQQIAERGVASVVRQVDAVLRGVPSPLSVLNTTIQIRCPSSALGISIAVRSVSNPLSNSLRLKIPKATYAQLRPIVASTSRPPKTTISAQGVVEIQAKGMTAGDLYSLDLEVPLAVPKVVDALVRLDRAEEAPKSADSEYWMHAQVRYPDALTKKYPGGFDLRDVEYPVNVAVTEHIKTVIPHSFIEELETGVELLAEKNPYQKEVLGRRHVGAMRRRGHGDTMELLGNLQALFFPESFRKYVDVQREFEYDSCERGTSFYDALPIPTWPRAMTVVSRAQLGVDRWTADGILVYKRGEFLDRVRDVLHL